MAWQAHLESHGVARADEAYGAVLVFREPDNLQLELVAPPPTDS